jgi:carbonic anhydrase
VHGWYYDILTGTIESYDEKIRRFLPLTVNDERQESVKQK